jgi:NAD(P)-dependent dehydrogenase (short-subunit alcohol dehydrogenase family)
VVITGAAKGIGRACAEVFAREGARLELNDVDEAGLRQAAEGLGDEVEVVTVVANVSVEEDARRIVATALGSYGARSTRSSPTPGSSRLAGSRRRAPRNGRR